MDFQQSKPNRRKDTFRRIYKMSHIIIEFRLLSIRQVEPNRNYMEIVKNYFILFYPAVYIFDSPKLADKRYIWSNIQTRLLY